MEQPVSSETPAAPVVEDEGGLSDHEAAYGAGAAPVVADDGDDDTPELHAETPTEDRDQRGRYRHRASSQKASPDDVPQINALTKELRTKEQELAKARPDAVSGSPRLLALKRQIKAIEAELGELKPAPIAPPPSAPVARAAQTPAAPAADKPNWKTFEDAIGATYPTWADAQEAWADARDAWKVDQGARERAADDAKQRDAADGQRWTQTVTAYQARVADFAKTTPDYDAVAKPVLDRWLPTPLLQAIVRDDKGPQFVYYLGQHPDLLDEMHLLSEGKAPSDEFVALLQRRLSKATAQAVVTGSAAGTRPHITPRPPNPVRTGPMTTGDDLPGDESSLAEHERAFGRRRR